MAGVLDSDGYIGVGRSTYGLRKRPDVTVATYPPRVAVKQVQPQAVELFHRSFAGHLFLGKPGSKNGKPLYTWQVHSASCRRVLEPVLPFLRIKRAQAENALEVCRLNELPRRRRFHIPAVIEGEPLLTMQEAANQLGTSYAVVQQAVGQGTVPVVKGPRPGSRPSVFIPASFLDTWRNRGTSPRRDPEVTAALEACFQRAKTLNLVGI